MVFRPQEVEEKLEHKFGFVPDPNREAGHRWYVLHLPGVPTPIRTKVSHNKKDIGKNLAAKIARQLHVRSTFFDGMIACTNSSDAYQQQVATDPYPPFPDYGRSAPSSSSQPSP